MLKPYIIKQWLFAIIIWQGLIFIPHCVNAQKQKPISFANTYTLTEADGFAGYNYLGKYEYLPGGEVLVKDFFGNTHITGNNYIKKIIGLPAVSPTGTLCVNSITNEIWIIDGNLTYIVRNDSVVKTISFPATNQKLHSVYNYKTNQLIGCTCNNDSIAFFELKNYTWVLITKQLFVLNKNETIGGGSFSYLNNEIIITVRSLNNESWYKLNSTNYSIEYCKTFPYKKEGFEVLFYNINHTAINKPLLKSFQTFYKNQTGKAATNIDLVNSIYYNKSFYTTINAYNSFCFSHRNGIYTLSEYNSTAIKSEYINFESKESINNFYKNPDYSYITVLTGKKPIRAFPYIKKYPYIFNNNNSDNIFMLSQDEKGRIWAGNYQNDLSIISAQNENDKEAKVQYLGKQPFAFLNAEICYKNNMYFVGESTGGIIQYNTQGKPHQLQPNTPNGYTLYLSNKTHTLYFAPICEMGTLWYCNANELNKPKVAWTKIDFGAGKNLNSIISITEDTLGRIWYGHPKNGWGIFYPETKKFNSYQTAKKETPIGFISSVTDSKGTVFMGSDNNGLWYYNDYSKEPTPANIHNIYHPLLNNTIRITAMCIYKNWLVMGCYNKICLLNLDSFYLKKKAVVKYLNLQESNFSSFTEQNTMLVSNTDSSIWFSTGDMLYEWDIKTWLQLPQYKVALKTYLQTNTNRNELAINNKNVFRAGFNNFSVVFEYLSKDCLPRYTRTAFIKQGELLHFTEPNLQSKFSYQDLSSGNYTFYIQVFEQDGSTTTYTYQIIINKYLWQYWWFWVLASFAVLIPIIFWLNSLRKHAIQQKEISQLNAVTLSNQFRPHFILNALNTIGADLKDKPTAETMISCLGNSINLIFDFSKQKSTAHSLKNEWILIENLIQIHTAMYLPNLMVSYPEYSLLSKYIDLQVPMGIIEIFVENALLHGLRNKKHPPYQLNISLVEDANNIYFTINDNGIGRKEAGNISSHKTNGTSTKNLNEIIEILNKYNKNKIEITYAEEYELLAGTTVIIKLPKKYGYEY